MKPAGYLLALALTAGCFNPDHSNPLDPGASSNIAIHGPDTIASFDRAVLYRVEPPSTGRHPIPFEWSSSDGDCLQIDASGYARAFCQGEFRIEARYRHLHAARTVVVRQWPDRILFSQYELTLRSIGERRRLPVLMYDSMGKRIEQPQVPMTVASAQPGVVSVDGLDLVAVARGGARITVRVGAAEGELPVLVEPLAVRAVIQPTYLRFSAIGETQIIRYVAYDSLGTPIHVPTASARLQGDAFAFDVQLDWQTSTITVRARQVGGADLFLILNDRALQALALSMPDAPPPQLYAKVAATLVEGQDAYLVRATASESAAGYYSISAVPVDAAGTATGPMTSLGGRDSYLGVHPTPAGTSAVRVAVLDMRRNRTMLELPLRPRVASGAPRITSFTAAQVAAGEWRLQISGSDPDGEMDELHVLSGVGEEWFGFFQAKTFPQELCPVRGSREFSCTVTLTTQPDHHWPFGVIALDREGNASELRRAGP